MRAAALDRFGGPEVLSIRSLPVPTIDAHEVLIAVHTAGVGVWDADMREGWSPDGRQHLPLVLGTDGSGRIAAVGARVRRFAPGDFVYAYSFASPKGGFYAEYVAVDADKVAHIPDALDLLHAGAIPTTGLTALQGVDDTLQLERNESLIVHGATGGVGTLAIQFAKQRGVRVFGTGSGADGAAFVMGVGADAAADGRRPGLTAAVRRFAPDGVDAVLALTGNALTRCLDALRPGGRVAYPNGIEPEPRKRRDIRIRSYDAIPGVNEFLRLRAAVDAAKLQVRIAGGYRLEDAARSHRRLARGHVFGKVVLRIGGDWRR